MRIGNRKASSGSATTTSKARFHFGNSLTGNEAGSPRKSGPRAEEVRNLEMAASFAAATVAIMDGELPSYCSPGKILAVTILVASNNAPLEIHSKCHRQANINLRITH